MDKRFLKIFVLATIVFSIIYTFIGCKISNLENLREKENKFYSGNNLNKDNKEKDIKPLHDNEILFLVAGIDHSNLSDVLVLCKANFKTGEIDLISIPRDSRVYVDGKLDKINHAHGKGGIDLTLQTIRDFLDINIDYYVRVDFQSVKSIVNAIDGVDIDVKRNMYYKDTTAGKELFINIKKGQQVLNGDKALEFLRFRSYPDGDEGRVKAQQQFMEAFIKQSLQVKNITKLTDLLETYYGYVDTNISSKEISKALKMVFKWDKEKIQALTIPGEGEYVGKTSYFIVDEKATEDVILEILGEYLR